jgi:hypothetical protein
MADDRTEKLKKVSVDTIEKWYKDGHITAGERRQWLRDKAKIVLDDLVKDGPYATAVFQKAIANVSDGWENIVEGFKKQRPEGVEGEIAKLNTQLEGQLQMFWGGLQTLTGALDAFGDVNGARAEQWALHQGAHPGVAYLLGFGINIGSSALVPVNLAAKGVTTAVKASGVAEKVAGNMTKDARIVGALVEAFKREGIDQAEFAVARLTNNTVGEVSAAKNTLVEALMKSAERNLMRESGEFKSATSFLQDAKIFAEQITKQQARAELPKLMRKFGVSWPDLKDIGRLMPGKSLGAQQFYGYLKALERKSGELSKAAAHAIAPDATDFERMQFARLATQLFTGQTDKMSYTKEFTNLLMHWDPASVARGDLNQAMRTFAEDLSKIKPGQVAKLAQRSQDNYLNFGVPPAVIYEMYRNFLLFATAPVAFSGNVLGASNLVMSRLFGGHPREAAMMMKGMALATSEGLKAIGMTYRLGSTGPSGSAGQGIRWVGQDALVALDAFFKTVVVRGSLWADGYALGHRGATLRNWVSNPPGDAIANAMERAYRATYQNDMGWFLKGFSDLVKMGETGPGNLYFAFLKGPTNMVKHGWDNFPGLQMISGRLWHDVLAGGTLAEEAMGRITMSWMMGMMVWEMAKEGMVTGSGPADPALRKAWLAVNEPYSFKTPAGWVPYGRLDPIAMPIGLVADLAQMADQLDEEDFSQTAMAAIFAFARNVANKTAWMTMSNILDVAQGLQRGNREGITRQDIRTIAGPAITTAAGGPLVSRFKESRDPVQRDARNFTDMIKSRVPGFSETVPPLRDGYGDPVIPPSTVGNSWFGYFHPLVPKMNPLETDKVKLEGARLQAKLPDYPDVIGETPDDSFDPSGPELPGYDKPGVKLTPQQRDRWQQLARNIIRNPETGLQAKMDTQEYQDATDAEKRVQFSAFVSEAKKTAKGRLLLEDVELGKKYYESKSQTKLPRIPDEYKPEIRDAYRDVIDIYDELSEEQKEALDRWGYLEPDKPYEKPAVTIGETEVVPKREYKPVEVIGAEAVSGTGKAMPLRTQ